MARTKNAKVPEVGAEVPEFNLPSAQGGSLRLGMRTATGPVIVAFFRGADDEDDVSYFKKLAGKEDEINLAIGNVVGIGVVESTAARDFAEATGMKSYILYDYAKVATGAWGLLERDKKNGDHARPATFLIDSENKVVEAWMDTRPSPEELLAKVSDITGLPKEPEDEDGPDGKPKKGKAAKSDDSGESDESAEATEKPKREKPSPEEREKRRAERKAAKEGDSGAGASEEPKSAKPRESEGGSKAGGGTTGGDSAEGSGKEGKQAGAADKPETKDEVSGGAAGKSAEDGGAKLEKESGEAKEEKQPEAKSAPESGAEVESSGGDAGKSDEDGGGAEGGVPSDEGKKESSGGGSRGVKREGS